MDMVEQPRADWHFCLGLLIECRPIAGVTGSNGRTVELSADPFEEANGWERQDCTSLPGLLLERKPQRKMSSEHVNHICKTGFEPATPTLAW